MVRRRHIGVGPAAVSCVIISAFLNPVATAQPIPDPRAPAEFEEVQGVVISWFEEQYLAIFYVVEEHGGWTVPLAEQHDGLKNTHAVIIQEALNEGIDVYVVDDTSHNMAWERYYHDYHVADTLLAMGISSPRLHIIEGYGPAILNTPWVRDWGPFGIYRNEVDSLCMAGGVYSGLLAEALGRPFYGTTIMDGGNFLTDGHGKLVCDAMQPTIDPLLFGMTDIDTLPAYKVHVDYYMKMVNEETVIINEVPYANYDPWIDHYFDDSTDLEAVVAQLEQDTTCYGRPYRIIRIRTAPTYDYNNVTVTTAEATYANALILNRTVLVPQYEYSQETDSVALERYRQCMPGYRIVGVPSLQYGGIGGAVHCITREIAASEPVLISHAWYQDTLPSQAGGYPVTATIRTRSGVARATLYWSTNPSLGYESVAMTAVGDDRYEGTIPFPGGNQHLYYYIEAESESGRVWQKPPVAPDGVFAFVVEASGPCACTCHGDPICDGATDVLDVVNTVNVAFRGAADIPDPDPGCPVVTTDVNCDGATDVLDVVRVVNVAFRGGDPGENFCEPCGSQGA